MRYRDAMEDDFLDLVSHRPFPLPRSRWLWRQRWDSVLLLHFRVAPAARGPLVPPQLALDEADGSAWVSVVPFRMCNVRPRCLPAIGPLSNFAELNVRTYVRAEGKPGVFFLKIHARRAPIELQRSTGKRHRVRRQPLSVPAQFRFAARSSTWTSPRATCSLPNAARRSIPS